MTDLVKRKQSAYPTGLQQLHSYMFPILQLGEQIDEANNRIKLLEKNRIKRQTPVKVPLQDKSKKNEIIELQTKLYNAGAFPKNLPFEKAVDGKMGKLTRAAMAKANSLNVSTSNKDYNKFMSGFQKPMNMVQKAADKSREIDRIADRKADKVKVPYRNTKKNETIALLENLFRRGFYPKGMPANKAIDGILGNATKTAIEKSKETNTEEKPKLKSRSFSFAQVAEPYAMFAEDQVENSLSNKQPGNLNQVLSILDAPIQGEKLRFYANKDGYNNAYLELKKGNLGRAAYSFLGSRVDAATTPITAVGLKTAPSLTMPFKDIVVTGINRLGRQIFNDPNYTAVKGRTYTNSDYSSKFNEVGEKMAKSNGNGFKNLTPLIKKDVDPSLDYGSSKLLLHPFNPTAGFAWTIGGVAPRESESEVFFNDPYDNSNRKTKHYLSKQNPSFTDLVRGIGGLYTSHDEDPDEGKQHSRLTFKK